MDAGVVLLNFGEPSEPNREVVVEYLTRIFYNNADLEDADSDEAAMERSRELAQRRAPGLIEEYEAIGGSPLNEQSEAQADALRAELTGRGYDVQTYVGLQFMEPLIPDVVETAHNNGHDVLIGLPAYPLCGPSTTVAALETFEDAIIDTDGWDPAVHQVSGWHRHPAYNRLRADAITEFAEERGVDLHSEGAELVFSAHGTPQHYLEQGSRYGVYVTEWCETIAGILGVEKYHLGYQNHENRDIPWTKPDVETVVEELDADHVVVDPISFMHEQSETLSELDDDLREEAEAQGIEFHRVPVPHDDSRFAGVLADLVEPFLAGFDPGYYQLRPCQCADENAMCLNAPRNQ